VIPLTKDGYFPQGILHAAIGMVDFVPSLLLADPRSILQFLGSGSMGMEFVPMALFNVSGAPCQFSLKPSPDILLVVVVFLDEQAECFLGGKLGDSGKIPNTEPI